MKSILRFLAGAAILAVGIFVMNALIGMKTDPPVKARPVTARPVKAIAVALGSNAPETPVEGRVDALYRMNLFAEVNGVLSLGGPREFREGMRFRKGEPMLRLDDSEPRASLVAQRSSFLQSLSAALADLQLDFPSAADAWLAYAAELDVNATLPELPDAKTQRLRLFLANRGILSAFHSIRAAEERLAKYRIDAPFDGVLTAASVRPGALVRAGQPLGTLVGMGRYEVKTAVHARYLEVIADGDSVVFFEESGVPVAVGEVARVASNVDPATQSASVFCEVEAMDGQEGALRDGRYLSGKIVSAAMDSTMVVGADLVSTEGGLYTIGQVDGETVLQERRVDVRFRSQERAIIAGIGSEETLLAAPISGGYVGMPVNIIGEE